MQFIIINGEILEAERALIRVDNHSYRYGDGLFETMKIIEGRILLVDLHFERLFNGFSVLKFRVPKFFTGQHLEKEILGLCKRNNCEKLGRIRLSATRGNGGLYDSDEKFQYIIECWSLVDRVNDLGENARLRAAAKAFGDSRPDGQGLTIDIFPGARKPSDIFSNLKSANYLPYVMAARFAKENKFNDCLLLNSHHRICDSTIANIFWITDGNIFTPPLNEGCIAGVMRKYLIGELQAAGHKIQEINCEIPDIENADEVFLTNVIQGIRWVKQFRNRIYTNEIARGIHKNYIQKLIE